MRNISEAAKTLMYADSDTLQTVALRDPSMVRDVAAALISRMSPDTGPGCGSIDCVNHCAGDHTHETCPRVVGDQRCDDDHGCGENPCICR